MTKMDIWKIGIGTLIFIVLLIYGYVSISSIEKVFSTDWETYLQRVDARAVTIYVDDGRTYSCVKVDSQYIDCQEVKQ